MHQSGAPTLKHSKPPGEISTGVIQPDRLRALIALLQEHKAWHQLIPDRKVVPDESRGHLAISIGERKSAIWEWYNHMDERPRISRVREAMLDLTQPSGQVGGVNERAPTEVKP
jgi:hypothetical protein